MYIGNDNTTYIDSDMAAMNMSVPAPLMNWVVADIVNAYAIFRRKCGLMFNSVLKDASESEKAYYLLLWTWEKGLEYNNSWTFEQEEDKEKTKVLVDKFE